MTSSSSQSASRLFKPLQVGRNQLSHRLVLAPLTRFRAQDDHVPTPDIVAEYYAQRACEPGTLLITEATFISPQAAGYANVPGIWSQAQIDGWKSVTKAVHDKGSYIYLQLWALGRTASAENLQKEFGLDLVSASAIPMPSKTPAVPRALTEQEIESYIKDYAQAAKNAIEAGFDGVELHGANGYLIDQFLQDKSNQRTDRWGGSIENRARFGIEAAKAVTEAIGADRTGYRVSPWSTFQGMRMDDPKPQFTYLVKELSKLGLAYIHATEARAAKMMGDVPINETEKLDWLFDAWKSAGGESGAMFAAGGFEPDTAKTYIDQIYPQDDIAVVFGRHWIANPDLVFRIREGIPFTPYDRSTFYAPKQVQGYTTYEFSDEYKQRHSSNL